MAFKRLLDLARRPGRDPSPAGEPAIDSAPIALDDEAWGPPPVLRPAAIFRQLLFDPAESAPVWARPRPTPAPAAASSAGPVVDRPAAGRPKASGKTAAARTASTSGPKPTKRTRRSTASDAPAAGESPAAAGPPTAARTRSKRVAKPRIDATEG